MMLRATPLLGLGLALAAVACGDDELAPSGTGGEGGGGTTTTTSTGTGDGGGGGDATTTTTTGSGGEDPCQLLTPQEAQVFFASWALHGVEAPVDAPLDDTYRTRLTVELYADDGSGTLPPLEEGVFDLTIPPDDNYGTCQHCVLLVGYDASKQPVRAFSPTEGTMIVTDLGGEDAWPPSVTGRLEGVRLAEVTQNEDFTWEFIPGGECFRVADWGFDTTPGSVEECGSAEACGHEGMEICEPETGTCGEGQCSLTFDPPFCAEDELCLSQLGALDGSDGGPALGACYAACDPAAPDCDDGEACVPLGPTQAVGYCLAVGGPAVGQPCDPSDIATGCEEGSVCRGEPATCAAICDYLTEDAGCPAETYCAQDNACRPARHGDAAAVGEACDDVAPLLFDCGIEGDAFRGLCINFFPGDVGTTCERMCRIGEAGACPGDEECLGLFSNPEVGICRAPAVCGDGELDVIGGEICDDGNDDGGDGCSADCREAELGPLCESAPDLPLGVDVEASNEGGPTGYTSSCDPYVVNPVARWTFTPPAAGRLTVELSSVADLGLSVLGDCVDSGSELGCANFFGDDVVLIDFTAASATPALVLVRGANPSETGDFVLHAEFVEAVCGDGSVGGAEICDDGNVDDGDGCSADCATIEWAEVCADLPLLPLDEPVVGDTTDGSSFYDLAGFCSWAGGSGPERAFRFVAPSTGTLSLELQEPEANFSLFVMQGCGPVTDESYLACSNFSQPGFAESTMVEVTEGDELTIVVDGFTPTQAGPFTLTATLD